MSNLLQQGVATTLVTYPPTHLRGLISSATVRVGTPAVTMPDLGSAAAVSSLSTTLTAASAEGTKVLSVASATGAEAGTKLFIDGLLVAEIERVSGLDILLTSPVPRDIASGATVIGLDISIEVTAVEAEEPGNAVALWTADDGSTWVQPFRIAHRTVAYSLDFESLRQKAPIAIRLLPSTDKNGVFAIQAAWDSEVARYLLAEDMRLENIRSWEEIDSWHAAATVQHLLLNTSSASEEEINRWSAHTKMQRSAALDSRQFWYSDETELGVQPDNPVGKSRLSFRR